MVAIRTGERLYAIRDPLRASGWLTWDTNEGDRHIMVWTTSNKAEEYNEVVMDHRAGDVVMVQQKDSKVWAKSMVAAGINYMLVDFPIATDDDWAPIELKRDYCVVNLKEAVKLL
jgi:hypothetical protein